MTPASPRHWTLWLILGAPPLLIVALLLGCWWHLIFRPREIGAESLAEYERLCHERRSPSSPVDKAAPDTFVQTLEPLLPELYRLRETDPMEDFEVRQRCDRVIMGRAPVGELPSECRESLERGRALMLRLLKASRTQDGRLPRPWTPWLDTTPHERSLNTENLLRLAALEVRLQAEARQTTAVETCLDALALARDVGHGGGILGTMVSWAGSRIPFSSCAAALQSASPASLSHAESALRRIREGLSPFSIND